MFYIYIYIYMCFAVMARLPASLAPLVAVGGAVVGEAAPDVTAYTYMYIYIYIYIYRERER